MTIRPFFVRIDLELNIKRTSDKKNPDIIAQIIDMLLFDAVSPQPFLKVHGIHRDNLFKSHWNGSVFLLYLFFLGTVAVDSQQ